MSNVSDRDALNMRSQLLISLKRIFILAIIATVILGPLSVLNQTASAAQVTSRSVNISNSVGGQTGVTYTFTFTPGTAGVIQSMFFQTCNTAVGTCVAPTGMNLSGGVASLTSGWAGLTLPFTPTQNTTLTSPACNVTTNLCLNWTDTTAQTTSTPLVIKVTGVTNQTGSSTCTGTGATNCTFFIRMTTYSDTAYTTAVDSGNVASATTQPLTVTSIIQEELTFCVGTVNGNSTTVETYNYALPNCSTLSGSSINLGTLSYADVSVSPVPTTQPDNGDLNNGVVELNTNAYNGTTISYTAIQQAGTNHQGAMRVPGATCATATSFTDQCINSDLPAAAITAGTESFGMAVPGINCSNTPTITGYSCSATAHNLTVATNYQCAVADQPPTTGTASFTTYDTGGQSTGTTKCTYAWDEGPNTQPTVASSAAPNGVVPGEALIVEFAATPEVTTPTGTYSAIADFIATPVY